MLMHIFVTILNILLRVLTPVGVGKEVVIAPTTPMHAPLANTFIFYLYFITCCVQEFSNP